MARYSLVVLSAVKHHSTNQMKATKFKA